MSDYKEISNVTMEAVYKDERGLHIRLDTKNLSGLRELLRIGRGIKRPVNTSGDLGDGMAYVWITIPMKECSTDLDITNKAGKP